MFKWLPYERKVVNCLNKDKSLGPTNLEYFTKIYKDNLGRKYYKTRLKK